MAGINAVRETSFPCSNLYSRTRIIECSTIDDMFSLEGQTISLKIDVEAHEADVLEGAKILLEHDTCIMEIETYKNLDVLSSLCDQN
jgi:FkbM family methyltransferase